ncbi:hypothetical protein Pmar_PMAR027590 [Perkinsus marinus ATCC 50983]|uniref:Uncharacterized protein n=1 Tax=Perkinsus marinus (strain ATCC 50983 / TXsc) TaxID=423536 RepID=C5KC62_PERM5|nr:hypothetical protein Pmar_PMAR027590 [Perkinsus marinus ATCC 50983]EER17875.1 hypothetical protein Pmar_PMAR027590 [Perkinsus marinus ATCC 50983]|eukprot:XP_002786079.1 hypothetical protein Pmar_PMAR027590 [Perkinsus marinus ATCC 50983]
MYRSNCKLVILVLIISMLSVFADPPKGHYVGSDLKPSYLRIDAAFSDIQGSMTLHFSIECGATRKRFDAWFGLFLLPNTRYRYAILPPLDEYNQLLSFYNKECGRAPASFPDFYNFGYDEVAGRVSVLVTGPERSKMVYLYKHKPSFWHR